MGIEKGLSHDYEGIDFSTERNVWEYFFGTAVPKRERDNRQAEMQQQADRLKALFRSRKRWVAFLTLLSDEWDECVKRGKPSQTLKTLDTKGYVTKKNGIHPRALRLLAEHGSIYTPGIIDNRYPKDPERGQCFKNSCTLMLWFNKSLPKNDMVYVEGLVIGSASFIMPHGWNAYTLAGRKTVDWTHYAATRWNHYFGISFTESEVRELAAVAGHPGKMGSIFSELWFTSAVEMRVREILVQRAKGG
jgi:hypothetical protein